MEKLQLMEKQLLSVHSELRKIKKFYKESSKNFKDFCFNFLKSIEILKKIDIFSDIQFGNYISVNILEIFMKHLSSLSTSQIFLHKKLKEEGNRLKSFEKDLKTRIKSIQKMIKKELSEEMINTFDINRESNSSYEIDQLIKMVSLNIIKTREILKETFDEYITTLISFDKIKEKIKYLKLKNDESFNDCSPVFSKKFKLISNIENKDFELSDDNSNANNTNPHRVSAKNLDFTNIRDNNSQNEKKDKIFQEEKNTIDNNKIDDSASENSKKLKYSDCNYEENNISQPEEYLNQTFDEGNDINDGNIDVNSLYLESGVNEQDKINLRSEIEKSEKNFRKNFPMRFYHRFQTSNNKNLNISNHSNLPNKEDISQESINYEYNYNFNPHNFSNSEIIDNKIKRNKNRSSDFSNKNFLNKYEMKNNNEKSYEYCALESGNKSNFLSPFRKNNNTNTKILNTGNKIKKMSYFENENNSSLINFPDKDQENNQHFSKELNYSDSYSNNSQIFNKSFIDHQKELKSTELKTNSFYNRNIMKNKENPIYYHYENNNIYSKPAYSNFNSKITNNSLINNKSQINYEFEEESINRNANELRHSKQSEMMVGSERSIKQGNYFENSNRISNQRIFKDVPNYYKKENEFFTYENSKNSSINQSEISTCHKQKNFHDSKYRNSHNKKENDLYCLNTKKLLVPEEQIYLKYNKNSENFHNSNNTLISTNYCSSDNKLKDKPKNASDKIKNSKSFINTLYKNQKFDNFENHLNKNKGQIKWKNEFNILKNKGDFIRNTSNQENISPNM